MHLHKAVHQYLEHGKQAHKADDADRPRRVTGGAIHLGSHLRVGLRGCVYGCVWVCMPSTLASTCL